MMIPDAEALYQALRAAIAEAISRYDALVGIRTGGVWIAERLMQELQTPGLALGRLDVSFYRDDLARRGLSRHDVQPSELPFEVEGARILLIDDVLYTGRTVRAALNELFDYGRPKVVHLAVLADRGARELPIAACFCPWQAEPALPQNIRLELIVTKARPSRFRWELIHEQPAAHT